MKLWKNEISPWNLSMSMEHSNNPCLLGTHDHNWRNRMSHFQNMSLMTCRALKLWQNFWILYDLYVFIYGFVHKTLHVLFSSEPSSQSFSLSLVHNSGMHLPSQPWSPFLQQNRGASHVTLDKKDWSKKCQECSLLWVHWFTFLGY